MELKQKVVFITGGSKGIGVATAKLLSALGAIVIIGYYKGEEDAKRVVEAIKKKNGVATYVQCDVTSEESVATIAKSIKEDFGSVDVLINNAGIFDEKDDPSSMETFQNIFKVNFLGQVRVTNKILPLMSKGKIVFISSVLGQLGHGRPDAIAYSAMKAALNSYTKNLAKFLAPKILVNGIAPGKVKTPMWGEPNDVFLKEQAKDHLINRWIKPGEVADAVSFILQNDALCGEILTIDGGMSIQTVK